MDHNKDQEFQNKFNKNNHFLKRTIQLVISVSAFSLSICYSTGFSLFPHSFNVYFSTFLFSIFAHTLERKYMFLICNLAFLAKSSVSSSSSTSSRSVFVDGDDHAFSASELSPMKEPVFEEEGEEEEEEEEVILPVTSTFEEEGEEEVILPVTSTSEEKQELEQEQERECLIGEKERESSEVFKTGLDDGVESDQSVVTQEEDDDIGEAEDAAGEGGSEDTYSTDELNKKIEEFIRKMKEEIRIEAQQQLIAVE